MKRLPLLTMIGFLILAGGVLFLKKVTLLCIVNMDYPRIIRIRMSTSEDFSMFYIHSIYNESVVEEFRAEKDSMVLKGIKTKSPAVMEYYGFEDTKEFHPMDLKLGPILLLKKGMGEGQGLIVRDKKIYLSEIGERGDRIQLRIESVSLGKYLLSQFM